MAKKEAGENQIQCLIDRKLDKDEIVIEQTIIKDGLEEVFILGSIGSKEGITCTNGLLLEAEKRTKINISFRQVSHFVKNENNGFSFFFAALVTQKLKKGFSMDIKTVILVKDVKKEKIGKCILQNETSPDKLWLQKEVIEYFNIGTGNGLSVLQLINAFEKATGVKLNYKIVGRREGDIEKIWADTKFANEELG